MTQERVKAASLPASAVIPGDFLTPVEAASLLRVSKGSLYERLGRGDIPSYRFGRAIRLRRAHLAEYLERHRVLPRARAQRYARQA